MSEHKVVLGGVEYAVSGGTVLLDGVAKELGSGTVLVNGVEQEIQFKKPCTVTITVNGRYPSSTFAEKAYITIDGTKYYAAATLEVKQGTVIHCYACIGTSGSTYHNYVTLNGTAVVTNSGSIAAEYDYTLTGNLSVELQIITGAAYVKITEE